MGQASENDDGIADTDQFFDSDSIPVGEPNAAVAGGATDRFRIVGAVHSDSRLVESHPNYADEIVRARWQIEIVFGANAVVQHSFVVAKPRPGRRADYFPGSDRCGQRG